MAGKENSAAGAGKEFDIDGAAAEFDSRRGGGDADDGTPPLPDVEELDADGNPIEGEDPPGFLSYEEYVAQGGDPDMYRGRKAFRAEHERINENKRLRGELKGLRTTINQTMEAVNDWQTQERQRLRSEIEAELHTAKENEDVEGAIEAQRRLDEFERKDRSRATPTPQEEHPAIQSFREAHPEIDHNADDFDEEFNADVETLYNTTYVQLSQGGKRQLTEGQIKRILNKAYKEALELHDREPDPTPRRRQDADPPPESPRNQRRGGGQGNRRRAAATPREGKAEDFKIDNPRNPRQKNAAVEVRDMIKEKYGDDAAKDFERNLTS